MTDLADPDRSIRVQAPAKINLYLHVTARRDDGFHLLDSLVAFADIHDTLTLSPAAGLSLEIDGPFAAGLKADADNLVMKAAAGLADITGGRKGARIRLSKRLPVAAGIGGGSADAAAGLKGLMALWNVDPGEAPLQALALSLGADVPVCLDGRAAFMSGIGEHIQPSPALPECPVVLVNPNVVLSTPAVFKARAARTTAFSAPGRFDHAPKDREEWIALLKSRSNDLSDAALALAPAIGNVLAALSECDGALMTRMSGSGATCFALFADPGEAARAAQRLARAHPDWWVKAGSLKSDNKIMK